MKTVCFIALLLIIMFDGVCFAQNNQLEKDIFNNQSYILQEDLSALDMICNIDLKDKQKYKICAKLKTSIGMIWSKNTIKTNINVDITVDGQNAYVKTQVLDSKGKNIESKEYVVKDNFLYSKNEDTYLNIGIMNLMFENKKDLIDEFDMSLKYNYEEMKMDKNNYIIDAHMDQNKYKQKISEALNTYLNKHIDYKENLQMKTQIENNLKILNELDIDTHYKFYIDKYTTNINKIIYTQTIKSNVLNGRKNDVISTVNGSFQYFY